MLMSEVPSLQAPESDAWLNWVISVDDHVLEPADLWSSRLPERFKEAGPRIFDDGNGEAWHFEGVRYDTTGLQAVAGKSRESFSNEAVTYADMRPGCYNATARIADMDEDGVLASLCFPSFARFCGQRFYEAKDKELGFACVQAYNDFMCDEWAGETDGRLIACIMLPLWDPPLAAKEIERCAAKSARAITFSENPVPLGLPSIHDKDRYWDPVFAAAQETDMSLCTHIGSSSQLPTTSPDAPTIIKYILTPLNAQLALVDWLFSGNFFRFPRLKLSLSEGGVGWIPAVLERCDHTFYRQQFFNVTPEIWPDSEITPRELFRKHVYGCLIDDEFGSRNFADVGFENIMLETDYPHSDSNWPNSMDHVRDATKLLDRDQKWLVMQGNARRVYNLQDFPLTPTIG
jgi:predicted TIM-barrel fold metal-dependent hydrolase